MKKFGKPALLLLMTVVMSLGISSGPSIAASAKTKDGIVTENGEKHYYEDGKKVKNRFGVEVDGKYYTIDQKGVATRIKGSTKAESTALGMACVQLTNLGIKPSKASKSSSLRKAFDWVWQNVDYNGELTTKKRRSQAYYAKYGFTYKNGNCEVSASCFYYMARALGYKAKYVYGLLEKTTGGYQTHAWVTIKSSKNGKTYVYDPNFAYIFHNPEGQGYGTPNVNDGYKMGYTKRKADKKKGLLQYTYYHETKKGKIKAYK